MTSRRTFLTGAIAALAGAPAAALAAPAAAAAPGQATPRWGMLIDLRKCIGCQACTVACAQENALPEGQHRTHVPVYELDTPSGPSQAVLPRLCNHCDDPPCMPVCPVDATFKTAAGAVVVDADQCVGCGYCVQACPYEARFINHETGTADKCTFCVQRTEAGLLPACVETCVGNARVFGDLNDPTSALRVLMAAHETKQLRPEFGTNPRVHYIGLDDSLQSAVRTGGGARQLRQSAPARSHQEV